MGPAEVATMVTWLVLVLTLMPLGPSTVSALAYDVVAVADGGAIAGRVRFVGDMPTLPPLIITKDREVCAAAAEPRMLLVSAASGGVKDTVVALQEVPRGKAPPAHTPRLDNRGCVLLPRVQAVMVGTEIVVENSDPFLHTTRGRWPDLRQAFNLVFPRGTPPKAQRIRRPGVITVACDTHPHMRAYILAFPHPYFAVTDDEGAFAIDDIPPGEYTLQAWHEGWRILAHDQEGRPHYEEPYVWTVAVTVRPRQTSELELQLAARQ
jgi:hypothetical protein